jgi:hypothetical protein
MIQINKEKQISNDTTKLIIKTAKDSIVTPKVEPKKLKVNNQVIEPSEEQNTESLFIIY